MKKVILNQISKAVAGGSNYFYLPLNLITDKTGEYYKTTVDISKLFELDSNGVPVVKEINVYDEYSRENVYLSYAANDGSYHVYRGVNRKGDHTLAFVGESLTYDAIAVVESNTDETNDNSDPNDGGR